MEDPLWRKALYYLRLRDPLAYKAFCLEQAGATKHDTAEKMGISTRQVYKHLAAAKGFMEDYLDLWSMCDPVVFQSRLITLREKKMILRMFPPS